MAGDANDRLVIGIDYGTTYTGVAFCHSRRKGSTIQDMSVQLITDWPGPKRNSTEEKVPSEIAYFDGQIEWGNKIERYRKREAWTKLLLDEDQGDKNLKLIQELSKGDVNQIVDDDADDNGKTTPEKIKKPVEIITDFLSGVRTHVQTSLEDHYGLLLPTLEQEVVITVPAVWSDKAKTLTYQAICDAGFNVAGTKISMITEPEAAAIYILRDLTDGPFSGIKEGDHFVVCDAGGGTVDIITYRAESIKPIFLIKEAVVGTGAKCGAVFVDREFKAWLRRKLGNERFQKIKRESLNAGTRMMNDFETAKLSFAGDNQISYIWLPTEIGVTNDPKLGIRDGEIKLDTDDMREIFDPCVKKILELIDSQIKEVTSKGAKVRYILLAGGFGRSRYLFKRIKSSHTLSGIEVIKPHNAWSAVVRGAVIEKMEPVGNSLVQLRLCRRHYGASLLEPFDPAKHQKYNEEDKLTDPHTEIVFAKGCMKWILAKGDQIQSSTPRTTDFEIPITLAEHNFQIANVKIFAWNGDSLPSKENDNLDLVCILSVDLSKVPPDKFVDQKTVGDKSFKVVKCQMEIKIEGSMLEFRVLVGDIECCKVWGKEI